MNSRRYSADGIRGSAQRRDPRPLGGLQYVNQVKKVAPIAQVWQAAQGTMNSVLGTINMFQSGNLQGYLNQFQDVNYWLSASPNSYTYQTAGSLAQKMQVVVALIVTPEGFPLSYEILPGNTADKTTLKGFLKKIEAQYGKAQRTWVMDRGIPTEEVLAQMRSSTPEIHYLVGTPKGRLRQLEKDLTDCEWQKAREGVEVKLLARQGELYVLAKSRDRVGKERAMRRRGLKKLWKRLKQLQTMKLSTKDLLLKLGEARGLYRRAWKLINFKLPQPESKTPGDFTFALNKKKLREALRREGRYLLRTNLCQSDPAQLWELYIRLTQIEEAFKDLKGDLAIRPIFHQLAHRIEAHIFVAFLAYCLHVTLHYRLRQHALGLTPRAVLEKLATIQMLDAYFPTTDGRWLIFARYTQPEKDHRLLLARLELQLPAQSPPRITSKHDMTSDS